MNSGWFPPPTPPPPGWGFPPFFPQLLQMPPDRVERWHRIGPLFPALKEGQIPKSIPVPVLEKVLSDVKEEGNACFKDKDYNGAYEMYTCALHICKTIQTVHYSNVDRELLSAIFSNRAACSLKMDIFKESIQDCEIAIQQNADNIKAHYRMAVAYKSLKDYGSALRSAGVGRRQAEKLKKNKEMKEFDDLIREVESHTPSAESVVAPPAANQKSKSQPLLRAKPVAETASKSSPQKASQGKGVADQPKSKVKAEKAKNSAKKGSSAAEIDKIKEASLDLKKKDDNVPKKKVKKKVIPKKSQYQGKFSILNDADDSDDSDDDGDDDDDDDSNGNDDEDEEQVLVKDQEGFTHSEGCSRTVMGLDEFEQYSSRSKHARSAVSVAADGRTNVSQHGDYSLRNLQEKFLNNIRAESQSPAGFLSHGVHAQTKSPSAVGFSQHPYPPGYESWAFSPGQQVPGQNIRSIPNLMHVVPQPSAVLQQKQIFKADQNSKYGDFECIRTRAANQFPFDGRYDLTLACNQCYIQTGHGDAGYVCLGKLDHDCERNAFLIRQYGSPECRWQKIRPRDQRATFYGPFRLCRDYGFSRPCRSAEKDCSFAHSDEEVRLWTLDREKQFNLAEFVAELRSHVKKPPVPLVSQQHPGRTFTNSAFVTENYNSDFHQQQNNVSPFTPSQQTQYDFSPRYNQSDAKIGENTSKLFGAASTTSNFTQAATWARAAASKEVVAGQLPYQDPTSWARAATSKESVSVQQQLYQNQDSIQSARIMFPLSQRCSFRLVCNKCFLPLSEFREYYFWNAGIQHACSEDILAVQPIGANVWVRIRERINHREFRGNYVLCRHFETGKPRGCRHQESCQFAHNPEEQYLWTREKDGQFDIAEFVRQNRSRSAVPLFSVVSMLEKFPGEVRHLCAACLHVHHTLSIQNPNDPMRCNRGEHVWLENRVLIHFSPSSGITEVRPRPFKTKTAFFKLCQNQRFCRLRNLGKCSYAHSIIERDIWCLQRDLDLSEDQIVDEVAKLNLQKYLSSTGAVKPPSQPDKSAKASPNSHLKQGSPALSVEQSATPDSASRCPYNVIEVCKLCFQNGAVSSRKNNRCDGSGLGHIWDQNKMCLIMPSKKRLSALPKIIPRNNKFAICRHMLQKKNCEFGRGGQCQFAHSNEEIEVWIWMINNHVSSLVELVSLCQKAYEASSVASKPIPKGQSVISVSCAVAAAPVKSSPYASPLDLALNTHYCHYCSVHCNSQKQWDEHCASEKHMFNVNSDKEHQWNYRQPPWGIGGCNYELCDKHMDEGKCRFSEVPDMYNHCKFAHSLEELDEWKERWEWRQMKREIAKQEHLYSYMDALREDYETTDQGIAVITDEIDGVTVKCSSSLHIFEQKKNTTHAWIFEIDAGKRELHKVALLYDQDRLHFTLHGRDIEKGCQIAPGECFTVNGSGAAHKYNVEVRFNCGIFGSFSQLIVFDFNDRPVLSKRVNAELGTQFVQERVKTLREKLKFDRWTSDNRRIVWFDEKQHAVSDLNSEILLSYKTPSSADAVVTQQTVGVELNRHNYPHKMHKLLQVEELTQARIMSRLNLEVEITVMERIMEQGLVIARAGELFARVPLTDQLNEDTDAGHLVLSGVSRVLLAPLDKCDRVIYEAIVVSKENFDYNGRGRDHIYLCLSSRCCEALNLNNNDCLEVEIQFQLNRLPFCQMHYAVDQLHNTDVVFPDISRVGQTCNHVNPYQLSSDVLNEEQMKIIEYIVANREGYNPPLVIYGPFGTGKTETLAQAAMILAANDKAARILICTHSNSAADLYILRHFDAFVKQSCQNLKVLRLYTKERRTNTVPQLVKEYCLMSDDRSCFLEPTRDDVFSHQIVITTLVTSLVLTKKDLGLRGQFSHIFIDEAAQVLECETIMPLSLAIESTTVVLAGDYNQMAQKVYSKEAQRQRFHRSLVHRLFEHYKMYSYVAEGSLPNILLKSNYRTKMEVLRFLAAVFYGGPDKLVACSTQNQIENIVPLTFYTAFGRELQDEDSTSYYNMAEIEEIVERVSELCSNWPKEWEEKAAESILVVTPYLDQVQRIRAAMKRKSRELGRVSVDRVSNVQGTEFRAVFISTVRTQHLSEEPPRIPADISECDGEFGDFGFLSDTRLLNTAFTRARSFVAVVGDPVALCAIGECMTIWRTYLKHCQNLKSIHPSTVTLDTIKSHVQNLLNSPVCGPNLQKLCALHEEATSDKPKKPVAEVKVAGREPDTDFSDLRPDPNPFESLTLKGVFEDWSLDYRIEPDSIIQHLAGESMLQNGISGQVRSSPRLDDPLKLSCVRLHEKRGHATVDYVTDKNNKDAAKRTRQLLTADDSNKDYDSDVDGSSEDENDSPTANVYVDYMPQQLKELLNRQPERFKHCVLKIKDSHNMYARLLNCAAPCKQIRISNRLRCGRAFNNDEVVVEILPVDPEDEAALPDNLKDVPQGQVTGVLRRAYNPKYRMFVCMVEEDNTGLMTPINRSIPKIYNLEPSQRAKKGHVCVYTFTRDKEPVFHHYEPIDPLNPRSKLFIVRYLKWEAKFFGPLGIVVGVLPVGFTIEQAMTILNVEYYIPKKFKDDTLNEINGLYPSNLQITAKELSNRLDYRDRMTFTVDPADSKDLDDAISIEDLSNGHFLIGIHIADVSYFVKKGDCIDIEAEKRGVALYPFASDPIPMLADCLSADLCSLLPGKDRLTLSVLFTIDAKANVQKVLIRPSVIRSKYRLEYAQLEAVLKHQPMDSFEQQLSETFCLSALMLNRVAQIWRRRRLGTAALYHGTDRSAPSDSPEAHMMIEELMITANHHVAMHLYQRFPVTTPLCCQLPPDALEIDEWKQKYVEEAKNTVALMQPFKHRGEVCNCVDSCDCIPATQDDSVLVDIRKTTWEEIKSSVDEDDSDRLMSCVISPENHPKTALAMLNLHRISNRSQYFCSGDIDPDEQSHHSLNITFYVHFTSPIRRYMDIVVHRLLKASLDDQQCPYSQAYITDLCSSCTEVALKARCYEKAVETLHYAKLFQEKPVALFPVVESLEDEVQLHFPMLRVLPSYKSKVRFSSLCLSETPVFDEERELRCKWSKRIYDLKPKSVEGTLQTSKDFSAMAVLDNNKYILQTTASDWRELLWSVISSDKDLILNSLMQVDELLVDSSQDDRFAVDVTSEGFLVNSGRQFCDFSLNVRTGNVVRVQVASELLKGMLVPSIQLFNLTPTLSICLEHRMNAIKCFAGTVALCTAKKSYRNVEAYQDTWLPLLAMEASYNAVLNNECAVIHNVGITWREESTSSRAAFVGVFDIPIRFCRERQIVFRAEPENEEEIETVGSSLQSCHGYFCVQYPGVMTDKPKTELPIDRIMPSSSLPATWVGHCVASQICLAAGKKHYTVELRLVQSSCPPPQKILQQSDLLSTLEWIPKPLPYCRMTDALYGLKKSSQLALDIALGKNPKHLDESYLASVDQWKAADVPVFPAANQVQAEAVSRALHSSFMLIQGPPGTGKTVVGARLAYIFTQINQTLSSAYEVNSIRPQVLFCGPSNKSVDVMARYLMELKEHCPRLVRIYSETSERDEFPQPQDLLLKRKRYNVDVIPDDLKPISLHHRVRSHCSNSALIVKMDNLIRSNPGAIDFSIKDYLAAISLEEREVLREAEVILCTCATSGASRVKDGTNIAQLIVDESGMCMEPETLIPIVGSLAKQIVLIGDHKQLQPIVKDNVARTRGLVQSLFERYSNKALTLTTQYRMHESIAEFSSKYFYDGQLQVGRDEQTKPSMLKFWPNGRSKPLAFVHVMGIEQALTVNTVDGNEHSQSNAREVDVVVRAASLLVRRFHVSPKCVAVLSQYRAQCMDIEKELLKRGEKEIPISTVVAAQGSEWDYVILSTVRSLPKSSIEKKPTKGWKRRHLGFITDTHQINVALTRAKKGLIIIGNKYLLQCDEMWKKLLRHYEAEKKIVDAVDFMV